jgi:hypothetical protein
MALVCPGDHTQRAQFSLDYKIVMDHGPDTEVLGRLASLDIANAAYLHVIVKYPLRNVQLRQGEQIIKRRDGERKGTAEGSQPEAVVCLSDWRQEDAAAWVLSRR